MRGDGVGPQRLLPIVKRYSAIGRGYQLHGARTGMAIYLEDWRAARDRLDRQIAALEALMADREANGYPCRTNPCESCAGMAAAREQRGT